MVKQHVTFFGFSVSLSVNGTTFIVGAPYNDANSIDVDVNANFGHGRSYRSPLLQLYHPLPLQ